MKKYIVDVQGFKVTSNEFIFKEVAVVSLEDDPIPSVFLFKPPYAWNKLTEKNKSENRWLEANYHGIMWRSGNIPYEEVAKTLRDILDEAEIYVKGLEKAKWLRRFFREELVFNVEDLGCPSLANLPMKPVLCTNHRVCMYPICALRNAMGIASWMLQRQLSKNNIDELTEKFNSMYI